ncbi:MAG: hypothetical protein ACLT2O_03240 [Dorea longicatena]
MAVNKVVYGGNTIVDISDSTVSASDMAEGVIAYEANGEKVTGNVHVESANTTFTDGKAVYSSITEGIGVKRTYSEDTLIRSGVTIFHNIDASNFGDALASDVAKGKTFTSVAGVKVVGTREESGGSGEDPTLNAEVQTIADVTAPKATFNSTGGTYKVYGYGKGTTSGYTTPKYAFCGDKYYTMASWGNDTTTSLSIEVDSSGNISGLPSLRSGELTIVRVP